MKQTCPTPRRQESTKSTAGMRSARFDHSGIVPLIWDRPPGEALTELLNGVHSLLLVSRVVIARARAVVCPAQPHLAAAVGLGDIYTDPCVSGCAGDHAHASPTNGPFGSAIHPLVG